MLDLDHMVALLSLLIGVASLIAGIVTYRAGRRRLLSKDDVVASLPTPLCVFSDQGIVILCNRRFARYFARKPEQLQGRPVAEILKYAGSLLVNEGSLALALEDWEAQYRRAVEIPGETRHCPPFEFRKGDEREKTCYAALWFHCVESPNEKRQTFMGIGYARTSYEMTSVHSGFTPLSLGVRLTYTEGGKDFHFFPNLDIVRELFNALDRSGGYVCVGSSAIRIHANLTSSISSLDVVIPGQEEAMRKFLTRIDDELGVGWTRIVPDVSKEDAAEPRHEAERVYVRAAKPGIQLNLLSSVKSWRLGPREMGRRRVVRRGNLHVAFPSLEDSILMYVYFDPDKELHSIHGEVLREMVRAVLFDGASLHRGDLEESLYEIGATAEEKERALALYARVEAAVQIVSQLMPGLQSDKLDEAWTALRRKGEVPSFLTAAEEDTQT